ncbi:MAG: hypothetical protein KDA75_20445 [Planctomycetaceae bacterium]|nr:hypothetical protein [Planctomycetaceae bacterium]
MRVAEDVQDFEIEGDFSLSKHGGWFWLAGWTGREGYLIYDAGLSSTTWFLYRISANPPACTQIHFYSRKFITGQQRVAISVRNGHLNFRVGDFRFLEHFHLPEYERGDVITGTCLPPSLYKTRDVTIHALRLRHQDGN